MKDIVTIQDIHAAAVADKQFIKALKSANPVLVKGITQTLTKLFVEMINIEHSGDLKSSDELNDVYWDVVSILFKHVDDVGITSGIGRHAALVRRFNFARQSTEMAYDHLLMVQQFGVPDAKAQEFWIWCEANKEAFISRVVRPGYKLQSSIKDARAGFKGKGEPWQHMSPRIWVRLLGAALVGANIAGAVGSLGIAGGLCVVSAIAGGAGAING